MTLSLKDRFPQSLKLLGLNYGFSQKQFNAIMVLQRSDELRELAHQEWLNEQNPLYDDSNWRWYLSYVSMKNEPSVDLHYNLQLKNGFEP